MKGFVYMLESVFAGLLLLGFMLFLVQSNSPAASIDNDFSDVLLSLDQEDNLRSYVYSGDVNGLESEISVFGHDHSVVFCNESGTCQGNEPQGNNVHAQSYYFSGNDFPEPMEVRLYVWKV